MNEIGPEVAGEAIRRERLVARPVRAEAVPLARLAEPVAPPVAKAGRTPRWVRAGLSVYILFHLFCVLLVPNSDNYTGNYFLKALQPYVYFFELTNNWNFFSPNPEPPIYVEYELLDDQGQTARTGRWPDVKDPFFWRERQTRRITAADFMVSQELRAEKMMVGYLCHQAQHPHSVRLWRVMEPVPTPDDVVSGRRRLGDGVGAEKKFVSHTFCDSEEGTRS
jgi:hypothetical protein